MNNGCGRQSLFALTNRTLNSCFSNYSHLSYPPTYLISAYLILSPTYILPMTVFLLESCLCFCVCVLYSPPLHPTKVVCLPGGAVPALNWTICTNLSLIIPTKLLCSQQLTHQQTAKQDGLPHANYAGAREC